MVNLLTGGPPFKKSCFALYEGPLRGGGGTGGILGEGACIKMAFERGSREIF